jgi:aminotransferase
MPYIANIMEHVEESMSIKYNTIVYEMRAKGQNVTVMSLGEAYFDIPLFSFSDLPYPDIYHYSDSRGLLELRQKLSTYFKVQYDTNFDPKDEIIVTAGSKVAAYMALLSIVNSGDEILYSEPVWVTYPELIKLCQGRAIGIPYNREILDYERYITARTKAIIITNPHNPRGSLLSQEELLYLLSLAQKYNLWLISDEAYSDFVIDDSFVSLGKLDQEKRYSIILNSLSKNCGISGWRLGCIISNSNIISNVLKLNQHLITCPATILEHYVSKYFDEILDITRPQIGKLMHHREVLREYMDQIGLKYLPGSGTFYFFVSISPSKLSSEQFCMQLLREHRVCVVPGIGYGASCDQFVRVSVGTASVEENMRGLDRIKTLIEKTS